MWLWGRAQAFQTLQSHSLQAAPAEMGVKRMKNQAADAFFFFFFGQESLEVFVEIYRAAYSIHNKQLGSNVPSGGLSFSPQAVRRCLLS